MLKTILLIACLLMSYRPCLDCRGTGEQQRAVEFADGRLESVPVACIKCNHKGWVRRGP